MSIVEAKNGENRRFLGVDPGEVKVGLAISDSETGMAFTYGTLRNDKNFWENFSEILKKESISAVILGIPSYANKKETLYLGEVWGERIGKDFPEIEVFFHNEMFSTKIAQDRIKERGQKNIQQFDDQEAARVILESWMEKNIRA